MSGRPIALKGHQHRCPIHGGGPVAQTQNLVRVDGVPVATVGALCVCSNGMDAIVQGSNTVSIDGKRVARLGDGTAHGGRIAQGLPWLKVD